MVSVNGSVINMDGSHYRGDVFTSNVNPSSVNSNVLPEPQSNIQAANSYIPCKGGSKKNKDFWYKIKKISSKYKMSKKKTKSRSKIGKLRKKVRCILKSITNIKTGRKTGRKTRRKTGRKTRRKTGRNVRFQKGGYSQYMLNVPNTNTYSTGGELTPSNSSLANPVPYQSLSNCTNCIDNYSRYSNWGFPSKGSF